MHRLVQCTTLILRDAQPVKPVELDEGLATAHKMAMEGLAGMMSKVGASAIRGLEQTIVFADKTAGPKEYAVHIPQEIDVRAIRARLGMTQQEFAVSFGFSVNTVRHWEQGRRVPEGPTRAYLMVIDREPKAVRKALRIA